MNPYTVVGCYPSTWPTYRGVGGRDTPELDQEAWIDGETYVEHVRAEGPIAAANMALTMDEARVDSVVVAVFAGHLEDVRV